MGRARGTKVKAGGSAAAAAAAPTAPPRRWEYLAPNVVLDRSSQTVYRLALNLPAVAESCSDPALLAGFLQRRRGPPPPPPALGASAGAADAAAGSAAGAAAAAAAAAQPKALLLAVVRNALQERTPLPAVRAIFDDLCAGYAQAIDRELAAAAAAAPLAAQPQPAASPAGVGGSGSAASSMAATAAGGGSAASAPPPPFPPPPPGSVPMPQYVSGEELAAALFRWLHDEEVVDAPYLAAALVEYMAAAAAAGVPLPPYLQGPKAGIGV
ncbi:hypothetical protein TSOC_012374 [Tetrabaena socialis]|uniref:Uncharacterized protein n=1 Tax=Tetrabaena socialis TaxID=47790 RepID=A0A2J7ZN83_9CHLO|nr:hypothetical protein TSOC_012374 [Tetrabaena socialis]|eukprot:PNH01716.1 hypothetical protein TSOC_012374 [Tetrabaena socialis]